MCGVIWLRCRLGSERDVAGVRRPTQSSTFLVAEIQVEGAGDAEEEDEEPDEEDAGGDYGFGFYAGGDVGGDFGDGGGDFVGFFGAGGGEKGILSGVVVVVVTEAGGGAEGEGVVSDEGEVDVSVVGDPGEAFLDAGDFEADEAFEDAGYRVVEDGAAEGLVEDADGVVDEFVEGGVDGARGGVDPAEDVVVDVVVESRDGFVGAVGPGFGGVVELVDDEVGELTDVGGEGGDFFLYRFEEDVLAEAGEETGDAE